jgi:dethiobiotin synthetase
MVPIAGGLLIADLVRAMELPLMVVCRPSLGTINHTLLTLFTARQMDLPTAGFLVNNMPEHPDQALSDTPHTLAALASADLLGVFDNAPQDDDRQKAKNLSEQLAALPTYKVLRRNLGWPEIGSS